MNGKVSGIAVHTGARVAGEAGAGEVLVSSTVKDLVAGSGIAFEDRGAARAEGRPGRVAALRGLYSRAGLTHVQRVRQEGGRHVRFAV